MGLNRESLWLTRGSDNHEREKGEAGPGKQSLRSARRSDREVTKPRRVWQQRLSVRGDSSEAVAGP